MGSEVYPDLGVTNVMGKLPSSKQGRQTGWADARRHRCIRTQQTRDGLPPLPICM